MKKSVLFVNGHLNVGGVEKALVDLLSCIDYAKYDVDLLLLEGDGDYRDQVPSCVRVLHKDIRVLEGPFWHMAWRNLKSFRIGNIFYRSIQVMAKKHGSSWLSLLKPFLPVRKHYDAAIAFRPGHYAEIVACSVSADRKYCWWHHGAVPDSINKRRSLERLLSKFDRIVAVSEGCKSLLSASFDIPVHKYAVIPNIVNGDNLNLLADKDNPYGTDNRFKIVTLCRFAPEKHLEEAVDAAAKLEDRLDFVWYLIGNGSEFERISEKVRALGLQNRIVLPGQITNPYPYLKHADLMVHPSHIESLCISVIEAMAMGLPCVVVRSIGPESFIEDGNNGIMTEKGTDALLEGIMKVVSMDKEELGLIRDNALMTVHRFFSPETVIKGFEDLVNGS